MDPLASFLLRLAAGIPFGQGLCQIPLEKSSRMPECQLSAIADALNKRLDEEEQGWPDPRKYHQEWARNNCIPPWIEAELWERKKDG